MLPTNKDARQKYDACYAAKRTELFEAAIAGPATKAASERSLDSFGMPFHALSDVNILWKFSS